MPCADSEGTSPCGWGARASAPHPYTGSRDLDWTRGPASESFENGPWASGRVGVETAVRAADGDSNRRTTGDPSWLPEVTNTSADPSYPGAHVVISAGGGPVLSAFLGQDQ